MADDRWEDISNIDYYNDIQTKIPGVRFTSGYRTPEYQADMKRRGYHPADNSGHLRGEKMDLLPPEGKSMEWLKNEVNRHYPYAIVNPNEGDHADVRFPGYTKAPALGGAAKAGVVNPNRQDAVAPPPPAESPPADDPNRWADVTEEYNAAKTPPQSYESYHQPGEAQIGINDPLHQAAIIGLQDEVETGKPADQIIKDHPEWAKYFPDWERQLPVAVDYARGHPGVPLNIQGKKAEPDIVAQGQPVPEEGLGHAVASSVADVVKGTGEGWDKFQDDLVQWGAKGLDAVGATDGAEDSIARTRDDLVDDEKSAFMHPDGWSRLAGNLLGEGVAMSPLLEIAPFSELGLGGRVVDYGLQGGVAGATTEPDNPVAGAAAGAVLGAGLGGGVDAVVSGLGSLGGRAAADAVEGAPKEITGRITKRLRRTKEIVDNTIKDWTNAPDIEVVDSVKKIKDPELRQRIIDDGAENDAQGFVHNGKVYVVAANHAKPEDVVGTVFHESLGHKGLDNLFKEAKDGELQRLYDNNKNLKTEVDDWMDKNGHTLADEDNPLARGIEEVLAYRSGEGQLNPGMLARLKQIIRQYARKMGWKKTDVSDDEVMTILGMAHRTVTHGAKTPGEFVDGVRYMYGGRKAAGFKDAAKGNKTFYGPDSRERFEFSDEGADFNQRWHDLPASGAFDKTEPVRLGDVFDHPELYKQYPDAADIKVTKKDAAFDMWRSTQGYFNEGENRLNVTPYATDPQGTTLHEVQHWIQAHEGFARGGNTQTALEHQSPGQLMKTTTKAYKQWGVDKQHLQDKIDAFNRVKELPESKAVQEANDNWKAALEESHAKPDDAAAQAARRAAYAKMSEAENKLVKRLFNVDKSFKITDELDKSLWYEINSAFSGGFDKHIERLGDSLQEIQTRLDDLEHALDTEDKGILVDTLKQDSNIAFRTYESLFGEIEARDTAARKNMTQEERDVQHEFRQDPEFQNKLKDYGAEPYQAGRSVGEKDFIDPEDYVLHVPDKGEAATEAGSYGDPDRVRAQPQEAKTFLKELGVFNNYELSKMTATEAIDRAARLGIDEDWLAYYRGAKWNPKTKEIDLTVPQPDMNRYKPDPGTRYARKSQQPESNRAGSINLDKIYAGKDIKDFLRETADKIKPGKLQTVAEMRKLAKQIQVDPKKIKPVTAEYAYAARQAMIQSARSLKVLATRIANGDNSDRLLQQFGKEMAAHVAIQEHVQGIASNAGRVLRQFREQARSPVTASKGMRFAMKDSGIEGVLGTAKGLQEAAEILASRSEEEIAGTARKIMDPKLEDYIMSWRLNSMFSGPNTHLNNMKGNAFAFGLDYLTHVVTPRELGPRAAGAIDGLISSFRPVERDGKSVIPIVEAFKQGNPLDEISKIEQNNIAFKGKAGALIEWPRRLLGAGDQLWRDIIKASEIRGLATRTAYREGARGEELARRTAELIEEPTEPMLEAARQKQVELTYLDDPTFLTKGLSRMVHRGPSDNPLTRTGKLAVRMVVPIMRVPDRLLAWAARWSPAGVVSPKNLRDFKAGGIRRTQAMARVGMGSAFYAWAAQKAINGELTGAKVGDSYSKGQEMMSQDVKPYSVKIDGKWVSYQGYDPLSIPLSMVAAIHSTLKSDPDADVSDKVGEVALTVGEAAISSTWMESVQTFMKNTDENRPDGGFFSMIGQMASTMLPASALMRQTQDYMDDTVRDRKGDRTASDLISGQVKNTIPGKYGRESLPVQMDVYGRPAHKKPKSEPETDPVIKELTRLSQTQSKPLVGIMARKKGETSEHYQQRQYYGGQYTVEKMREVMATPEWQGMNDVDKWKATKRIVGKMHKMASETVGDATRWEDVK